MSKYNPYEAINAIFNYKGEWDEANKAGDTTKKNAAAQNAVKYYEMLRSNGYADVADTLSQSNYTQAKYINDYYKSLQEASTPRDTTTAIQEENEKLFANYNKEYEDLKSTNPFDTEEGKAILAKYDLAGLQGRDNAVASTAGSNGGNIDSYAAANALRQQAALVNQGQQTVLSAYQQKLDHALSLLSDMGVNISRVHADNETTKQNDFAIEAEKATISGYTPSSWIEGATNPYLNADGTLKSEYLTEEFDNTGGFSTIIANAEKAGNTQAVQFAKEARAKKIFGNYAKYAQYDDGNYAFTTPTRTSAHELEEKALEDAKEIALDGNKTTENVAGINAKNELDLVDANKNAQKELIEESAKYGATAEGTWDDIISSFDSEEDSETTSFMNKFIKPMYNSTTLYGESELENVIATNSKTYHIEMATARAICALLGLSDAWLENYEEKGFRNSKKYLVKKADDGATDVTFEPSEDETEAPTEESAS